MPRLTEEHRIYCVEELIKTGSIVGTKRKLKTAFGIEISCPALRALLKKWQTKGTTKNQNKKNSGRRRSARNEETIDAVKARIADPTVSLRKLVGQVGISIGSLHTIMKRDIGLKPYKMQEAQELKRGDQKKRWDFCKKVKGMISSKELDPGNIIFTDESHVYLTSPPNKQNTRLWLSKKPEIRSQVPLHSEKVTVWCGFNAKQVFGPFFMKTQKQEKP